MLIKDEIADFAVFTTTESLGQDICIKDSCNRFFILHRSYIPDLIGALMDVYSNDEDYPVQKDFSEL